LVLAAGCVAWAQYLWIVGHALDPQGRPVAGASIPLLKGGDDIAQTRSNEQGEFQFDGLVAGTYALRAEGPEFVTATQSFTTKGPGEIDLQFRELRVRRQSVMITAKTLEPTMDLRNAEVLNRTLFTRDDQVLQQLDAGINAGQHEGGGKSLEIRRFGFNLDHGGVNGGLRDRPAYRRATGRLVSR
jgi:protocatechuate 3,4-dioxygenase beta subunit